MDVINLCNAKLTIKCNPCNYMAHVQSHALVLVNHISSLTKNQFWKHIPPQSSGLVLQTVLKAAEDIVPDKIPEFCAYGFLLLLPSHLYFNRLLRRRAITGSWSKQSHYHLFFTGPSLQLSLMEWQRIPRTFGSTTYKINLEYLVSREVRGKH